MLSGRPDCLKKVLARSPNLQKYLFDMFLHPLVRAPPNSPVIKPDPEASQTLKTASYCAFSAGPMAQDDGPVDEFERSSLGDDDADGLTKSGPAADPPMGTIELLRDMKLLLPPKEIEDAV